MCGSSGDFFPMDLNDSSEALPSKNFSNSNNFPSLFVAIIHLDITTCQPFKRYLLGHDFLHLKEHSYSFSARVVISISSLLLNVLRSAVP